MGNSENDRIFRIRLKKRQEVAKGTLALSFERPPDFTFKAGQFMDVSLPDLSSKDPQDRSRAFTIASAPSEPYLMFATRLRDSAFKRRLADMPLETEVEVEGPFGKFTLPDPSSQTSVFLAGGIGITPFRSMLLEAAHSHRPDRLILFYSNRLPGDAAFLDDLQQLERENIRYTCVATMTSGEAKTAGWQGATGRIDEAMIKKHIDDVMNALFYVVGPPGMVEGARHMLAAMGIAKANIRYEEFVGY